MSQSISDTGLGPGMPAHVEWLVTHRGPALQACLQECLGLVMGTGDAVGTVARADPSPRKHATQWLVDTLIAGGYHWEDLVGGEDSKVAETLGLFAQHRGSLPRGVRNLENHTSLASVYKSISHLVETEDVDATPTGRALRRIEREQARAESIILHESPELKLVVPLTMFAAQWWGRGTRWCTSSLRNNMFNHYNNQAPLVIAVLATTRYQMWLNPQGSMQFMDEADARVRASGIEEHSLILQPLLEWACSRGAMEAFEFLPPHARTPELSRAAVEANGLYLAYVPQHLLSRELCKLAVEGNADAIGYVPDRYIDIEMALSAVSRSALVMDCIPQYLRNRALYLAAFIQRPAYIYSIPRKFVDNNFCREAVDRNHKCMDSIPSRMVTESMHRSAVQSCPACIVSNYMKISSKSLCKELIISAIQLDCAVFSRFSTHERQTMERTILIAAAEAWPENFLYMPDCMKTPEYCQAAVQTNGAYIKEVPMKYIDQDMCLLAIRSNPLSLYHIPNNYKTLELCNIALQTEPDSGKFSLSIGQSSGLLRYVPDHYKTPQMCLDAVKSDGYSLAGVPEHMRTREIYVEAVRSSNMTAYLVPDLLKDREFMDYVAELSPELAYYTAPVHLKQLYALPKPEQAWSPSDLDSLVVRIASWSSGAAMDASDCLLSPGQPA